MYLDAQNRFSEDQAITAADTYESTNAIDLEATPPRQIGNGKTVEVLCTVTETFAGGTSLVVNLIDAANAALTTTPIVRQSNGPAILTAVLVAGYQFSLSVPVETLAQRFLGMQYVSLGTHTAGKITAGIVYDRQTADAGWAATTGF